MFWGFYFVLQKQATSSLFIVIVVCWNFATEYICKFHFVEIYIETHATYYRFSNIVLNLSNIFFYLKYVFEMIRVPQKVYDRGVLYIFCFRVFVQSLFEALNLPTLQDDGFLSSSVYNNKLISFNKLLMKVFI